MPVTAWQLNGGTQCRFSKRMNLDVHAEPFAASGHYYDYGELLVPRSRDRLRYGTSGTWLVVNPGGSQTVTADGPSFTLRNRDFNTLSFRSNVVLRWEWRTGSTLCLVWQQNRASTETTATRWSACGTSSVQSPRRGRTTSL